MSDIVDRAVAPMIKPNPRTLLYWNSEEKMRLPRTPDTILPV
ncbi:hypothetical protein [Metallosphaera sedula]|nr:hypothetical protein [Metallosphaera sedula]